MSDLHLPGSLRAGEPDGRSLALCIKDGFRTPLAALCDQSAGRGVEPQRFSNERVAKWAGRMPGQVRPGRVPVPGLCNKWENSCAHARYRERQEMSRCRI